MRDDLKISEIEEKYDGQWVVVEVTKVDKCRNPLRGRLLFNSLNEAEVTREGRKFREAHPATKLYYFYAGDPIPKGIGVMLVQG
jgi:hypothetical protein